MSPLGKVSLGRYRGVSRKPPPALSPRTPARYPVTMKWISDGLQAVRWGLRAGGVLCAVFAAASARAEGGVSLSAEEAAYVARAEPVRMCVDPDWRPFEWIGGDGQHQGIAADLIRTVVERTGLKLVLHPTSSWAESLDASRSGHCRVLSFVNQTPAREAWLIFTEPLFQDANVIVTRKDHPDVPDPARLQHATAALPAGTMVQERIERDYPGVKVIPVEGEQEAISLVSMGLADFTVRSLIVAAYTIKGEGLANLRIAGRMPDYGNSLRIGVAREEPLLRDILNKGVRTLSQSERDLIANRHAAGAFEWPVDYRIAGEIALVSLLLVSGLILRQRQRRRLDAVRMEYAQRQLDVERHAREEQSRLVAMVSHEVRTSLAIIDGAAQSLELLVPDAIPEVALRIERIRRGVGRLDTLTRQFLDKDRLDAASLCPHKVRFELGSLIADVIHELGGEPRVQATRVPGCVVRGDPALLRLAIRNLVQNALKYSPSGTVIRVGAGVEGGRVWVRVSDQGPGVPPRLRAELFKSYVRGEHGANIPGAGLGLYIVDRVARTHGGEARLVEGGEGAEFVIEWPDAGA